MTATAREVATASAPSPRKWCQLAETANYKYPSENMQHSIGGDGVEIKQKQQPWRFKIATANRTGQRQ